MQELRNPLTTPSGCPDVHNGPEDPSSSAFGCPSSLASGSQPFTLPAGQPSSCSPAEDSGTTVYRLPLDTTGRDDLLAALRIAADAAQQHPGCESCAAGGCGDSAHQARLTSVRAWRALAADIARLPAENVADACLVRFDPSACRTWLQNGAARRARIDDEFNAYDGTIAAGLEELLFLLNRGDAPQVWQVVAHLDDVQIWRTADSDGVDGGGVLTADLAYVGERVRLASLHQGSDEFTDDPETAGIDAAVQALAHVARAINLEYLTFLRATGSYAPRTDR